MSSPVDPDQGNGLSGAIQEALPHLSGEEILDAAAALLHEYVTRFKGSPESVLSAMKAAIMGAESGYGEAIEHEQRRPEEG